MANPTWQDYLTSGLVGTPGGINPVPTKTPDQISAQNSILSSGMNALNNPYESFQPIAQQARNSYQQNIAGLGERFTSMGGYGSGALSSPAFAGQLGSSAADFETNLAALQSQHGFQNRDQALRQAELGLQPQFQNVNTPGQPGLLDSAGNIIYPLAEYAGKRAGMAAIDSAFAPSQTAAQAGSSAGMTALKAAGTGAAAAGAGAIVGKGAAGLIAGFAALPLAGQVAALAGLAALGYIAYRGGKWVVNKFRGNK